MKSYGIMFHHFCGGEHPRGQGALSDKELEAMLDYVGLDNILPAEEFQQRALSNKLKSSDICLTFDDNLRCQYDVAYPVLKRYGIRAFWFVYTSPLNGVNEKLEVYRYYRTVAFNSIDDFYSRFFDRLLQSEFKDAVNKSFQDFAASNYLSRDRYYSEADKKFRFIRDIVLKEKYYPLMDEMIASDDNFSVEKVRRHLWMDGECIKQLNAEGHTVGLHSHTHPLDLSRMSYEAQKREYLNNYQAIRELLGQQPRAISYPSNSYNQDTLKIMRDLDISLGFTANMDTDGSNNLILPRNDHANILMEMKA